MADANTIPFTDDSSSGNPLALPGTNDAYNRANQQQKEALQDKIKADRNADIEASSNWKNYKQKESEMLSAEGASMGDMQPWNAQTMAPPPTNLWEKFGSPGMVIGMLASAFTGMPMVSALNAGAAAMNAINQNDDDAYHRAFDTWKTNTDLAIKRFGLERDAFGEIEDLKHDNLAEWQARATEIAARFNDQRSLAMIHNGFNTELDQAREGQVKAFTEIEKAKKEIEDNNIERMIVNATILDKDGKPTKEFIEKPGETIAKAKTRAKELQTVPQGAEEQAIYQVISDPEFPTLSSKEQQKRIDDAVSGVYQARYGARPSTAMEAVKTLEDVKADIRAKDTEHKKSEAQIDLEANQQVAASKNRFGGGPETIKSIAKGIKDGDQPPVLTGLYGMSGPVREELEKDGFDLAKAQLEWTRAQRQITALNGAQLTRYVGLARSVNSTIEEVRDLADQMQLGGVPEMNSLELKAYINTEGNSKNGRLATRYVTAVNTMKEEFANLAQGGYAPTEPVWKLANQQVNAGYGIYQINDALDEIHRLINYRLKGIPGIEEVGAGAKNRYTGEKGELPKDEGDTVIFNGQKYKRGPNGEAVPVQ